MTRRAFETQRNGIATAAREEPGAAKVYRKRLSDELDAEYFPVSPYDLTV
jgi:hypothetical protein